MADAPSVLYEVDVQRVDVLRSGKFRQRPVSLFCAERRVDQTEAAGDTMHVRVHGHRRPAQSEHQNAGGCLWTDTRQCLQIRERIVVGHAVE